MAKIYKCDRCGTAFDNPEYEKELEGYGLAKFLKLSCICTANHVVHNEAIDLCKDCWSDFFNIWMNGGKR